MGEVFCTPQVLRKQGGGDKSLLLSDLSHWIYQFSPENDKSSSQTHSFTKECSSRLSFSSGPSPHGVVSGQGSVSSVCWIFSLLSIDLFATCMNAQLPAYVCSVSGSVRGGSGNPVKSLGIFREFLSPFLLGRCSYLFCLVQRGSRPVGSVGCSYLASPFLVQQLAAAVSVLHCCFRSSPFCCL